MHARRYWLALTALFAALGTAREIPELGKPRPDDPLLNGTYTAWWKWLLGLEPLHWRRFLLIPAFSLGCAWWHGHIVWGWPGPPRYGNGRRLH